MPYSKAALGAAVKEIRESHNVTQEQLGTQAGYGLGAGVAISRIESGQTRPSRARLVGIANVLGTSVDALEAKAAKSGEQTGTADPLPSETSVRERAGAIQAEVERRTFLIESSTDGFNSAHDRARDEFFMPFVALAQQISGSPQPEQELANVEGAPSAHSVAVQRRLAANYGIRHVLAGGAGGAVAGAAAGGAAAYGTFLAAVSFGTASTGVAVSSLSGVAATNAALALLGGGTLAAGGAGMAGGAAILAGVVAAPAALLAVGAMVWVARRSKKQNQERADALNKAQAQLDSTARGVDALAELIPDAAEILNYVATHGGHALKRWAREIGEPPFEWDTMTPEQQEQWERFVAIAACQISAAALDAERILVAGGDEREELVTIAQEVLSETKESLEKLV
ncbi:helix-turn-helix transcriptional regulator [Williamsia sp.]|uniref:helix-turn-helix domain-containing protein n=1 Tax=Williamsia sp. TaxID=1872085 RepID=UPI001A2051EE|nr:helix-turn-helix transcriptional regulator [Williamsia sp.]MBJ7289172.1 helix-turn-helix transcriptional regulator [Williamsia sp.]